MGFEKRTFLKAKVHTLASDKEFRLIGIASHLSDYKLSWLLNEELDFKFHQSDDILIESAKPIESYKFSTYKYEEEGDILYTLFSNRSNMAILIKAHKNVDFILKIDGKVSNPELIELIEKIKKLKNILTAFEIDKNSLKSKENDLIGSDN
jgi:hypothetical protein